ncbi:hypothetical protein BJ878DRAFT_267717 [Calycina marina]|uniref:Uncharacterized protein n=1 Tax=Calycina marina TaxID=1763456 RepID=A0A9P8CIP1_9HELO|nr:hypothetical protein BJ878DRAFT_267717 [Calycina marina]
MHAVIAFLVTPILCLHTSYFTKRYVIMSISKLLILWEKLLLLLMMMIISVL